MKLTVFLCLCLIVFAFRFSIDSNKNFQLTKSNTSKHNQSVSDVSDSLEESDLNVFDYLDVNQKSVQISGEDYSLKEFFKFELIEKTLFDSKRETRVNIVFEDATDHKKINGVLKLKCDSKVVTLKDQTSIEVGDGYQSHTYLGQIEFLNSYFIQRHEWEQQSFLFIDKNKGEEIGHFPAFPYISHDKKHIILVCSSYGEVFLGYFEISNGKIKEIISGAPKYWEPYWEHIYVDGEFDRTVDDMFWGSDGNFYAKVFSRKSLFNENSQPTQIIQYIRITPI